MTMSGDIDINNVSLEPPRDEFVYTHSEEVCTHSGLHVGAKYARPITKPVYEQKITEFSKQCSATTLVCILWIRTTSIVQDIEE